MYYRYGYAWIKALQWVMTVDATKAEKERVRKFSVSRSLLFLCEQRYKSRFFLSLDVGITSLLSFKLCH
jgi:hypothetical protein